MSRRSIESRVIDANIVRSGLTPEAVRDFGGGAFFDEDFGRRVES
jgi:hypothetical protein